MKAPVPPQLEKRRSADFLTELRQRARAWISEWDLSGAQGDFGQALLEVAARFSSEIAERLDKAGNKMRAGFLDWLGMRGKAARPARVPVVFKLNDSATAPVDAIKPIRLQASAGATPVVFETEKSLTIMPAKLQMLVAADPANDAYYLPPPDLTSLAAIQELPTQWTVKSFAPAGATMLQLMPGVGLLPDMLIQLNNSQYTIKAADKDLITIDRPLESAANEKTEVDKLTSFEPFNSAAANQQEHILYIGDADLLNLEAAAIIGVQNATGIPTAVQWEYWGKRTDLNPASDEVKWQPLDPQPPEPSDPTVLLLKKPPGSMEQYDKINGQSARWIRAYAKKATGDPFLASHLAIEINPSLGCDLGPCPSPSDTTSIQADALANTTPLVLENVFFPFGKEPRQFDAFYLGSQEAFSKPGAKVQVCFEIADPKFAAMASLPWQPAGDFVVAAVGADGYLHLLLFDASSGNLTPYQNRDPLIPPSPGPTGAPVSDSSITLDRLPTFRPAIWTDNTNTDFFVAVSAEHAVWVWREVGGAATQSGWTPLGLVETGATSSVQVGGLVHLADTGKGYLFALHGTKLFARKLDDANGAWSHIETKDGAKVLDLEQIAPIRVQAKGLAGRLDEGLLAVDSNGSLYAITLNGNPLVATCTELLTGVATDVAPVGVRRTSDNCLVAVAIGTDQPNRQILAFQSTANPLSLTEQAAEQAVLDSPTVIGNGIDVNFANGQLTFVTCLQVDSQTTAVSMWAPLFIPPTDTLFTTKIPGELAMVAGTPTLLPTHVLLPTAAAEVLVTTFDPARRKSLAAPIGSVVRTNAGPDQIVTDDYVAFGNAAGNSGLAGFQLEKILANSEIAIGEKRFHPFDNPSSDDMVLVYRAADTPFAVDVDPTDFTKITTKAGKPVAQDKSILLFMTDTLTELYQVKNPLGLSTATLDRALTITDPTKPVTYLTSDPSGVAILPMLRLSAASNNWDPSLLDRTRLVFPGADPTLQTATAIRLDTSQHADRVALEEFWVVGGQPPGLPNNVAFIVDTSLGEWTRQLGDFSSNPALSWEYWNGTGWWALGNIRDDTLSLKHTGGVIFTVPQDLSQTDWSGKTNYWIRARLIGGDYGQAKVTVTTTDLGQGKSEQTIERSTDSIRVPTVLKLHIAYALCGGVQPKFVLTKDSGSIRDQSEANQSSAANVEAFVPLAVTLGRLLQSGEAAIASASADPSSAPCDCPGGTTTVPPAAPTTTAPSGALSSTASVAGSFGPCLFIGVNGTVGNSEDVHLLVLTATEHDYTTFAPLNVEAIVANRFTRVVASDGTRALGETGLIEMSFAVAPATIDLFGQSSLVWLRLSPRGGATSTNWNPSISGLYLNAVFAQSTETLTRELLGSADGSPNLTFTLARPPVLDGTLELRVLEPLGDEEFKDLNGRGLVLTENSGYWVRWEQVDDTADSAAGDRVYMLDELTGEIQFGDGVHGMIPPTGRDSIVAFSYQRTELPTAGSDAVPANGIPAHTTLNLVSPVETVESVTTAADSAGGAAPESVDAVLQFGYGRLRHRDRALTVQDFEALALESSTWIAQTRAFPLSRGRVEVVVVRRGKDPRPTLPQIRELSRFLLSKAPATLALPGALTIAAPGLRKLRIKLKLEVETLDVAADASVTVKELLIGLFDTTTGNLTGDGWALGLSPSEDVVALAIRDVKGIASIVDIAFLAIDEKGNELSWADDIKPTDLVVLADDPVRLEFNSLEVSA